MRMKFLAVVVTLSQLSGCAFLPEKKAPKFDASLPAASQAATFVAGQNTKFNSDLNKIAIASCNVLIGSISRGQAATSGGLFADPNRVEKTVRSLYYLRGISDEQLQALAEDICAQAKASIKAAGYQLVPDAELQANEAYQKLHQAGKPSPFSWKVGKTEYKVLSPKGEQVYNPAYLGVVGGLAGAFSAAAGNNALQHETRLSDSLKADLAHINIKVDFAQIESSGGASAFQIKNSASVSANIQLVLSGGVSFIANESLKCWTRFGKHECGANRANPSFGLKLPLIAGSDFVTEVKSETSTGDKLGNAVSGVLGVLGGGSSTSVSRTGVVVDPQKYSALSKQYFGYFMDMVLAQAKS